MSEQITAASSVHVSPIRDRKMSTAQIRRQLATYSLVSQRLDGSGDPIAALKPFFAPIAADWDGKRFDPATFRTALKDRYGLRISNDVTEIFVQKINALGLLRRVDKANFEWVRDPTFNETPAVAEERLNKLLTDASRLHQEKNDLFTKEFDDEAFLAGLQSVLLSRNIPLSKAVAALSDNSVSSSDPDADSTPFDESKQRYDYFAAEYIRWCSENDPVTFDWLSDLSASTFVSEALIGIRTPDGTNPHRTDLTIYLDTPFAMELLGCSGFSAKEDARFIVDTLKALRVPICILQHSVEELQGNLKAVLKADPWDRRGPTATAIIHQEATEHYLDDVRINPQHYLDQLSVQIVDRSKQSHHVCKDSYSDANSSNFYAKIYSLHENDLARQRDADSVEWIMYRRKGHATRDILRSKHLLLTRNKYLVRYAQDFAVSDCGYQRGQAGPAIGARELAGVLWLLVGQPERIQLSQRQLLLSCDRARASAPDVVAAMLDTVRAVNPKNAELIAAAMQRPHYLAMAMDAVANDGGRISDAAIESTLEAVRLELVAEERKRAAAALEEEKQRFESEAVLQRIVNQSVSAERDDLVAKLDEVAAAKTAAIDAIRSRLSRRFSFLYRLSIIALNGIVAVAVICGAVFGTDLVNWPWPWKAATGAAAALLGLYGTAQFVKKRIHAACQRAAERKFHNELLTYYPDAVGPNVLGPDVHNK